MNEYDKWYFDTTDEMGIRCSEFIHEIFHLLLKLGAKESRRLIILVLFGNGFFDEEYRFDLLALGRGQRAFEGITESIDIFISERFDFIDDIALSVMDCEVIFDVPWKNDDLIVLLSEYSVKFT